ncbi:MAG: hypothetical protein ACRC5C_06960 [Bacilli bacterium]
MIKVIIGLLIVSQIGVLLWSAWQNYKHLNNRQRFESPSVVLIGSAFVFELTKFAVLLYHSFIQTEVYAPVVGSFVMTGLFGTLWFLERRGSDVLVTFFLKIWLALSVLVFAAPQLWQPSIVVDVSDWTMLLVVHGLVAFLGFVCFCAASIGAAIYFLYVVILKEKLLDWFGLQRFSLRTVERFVDRAFLAGVALQAVAFALGFLLVQHYNVEAALTDSKVLVTALLLMTGLVFIFMKQSERVHSTLYFAVTIVIFLSFLVNSSMMNYLSEFHRF